MLTFMVSSIFCLSSLSGDPPEARTVGVTAVFGEGSSAIESLHGTVVAISKDGSRKAEIEETIRVPGKSSLELPPGVWEVEAKASGWWSGRKLVVSPRGLDSPLDLTLWRTGTLEATFLELPVALGNLTVRFGLSEKSAGIDLNNFSECRREGMRALCEIPVGKRHLRVGIKNHVPHYFFDQEVKSDKVLKLGELSFEKAASISGWVKWADRTDSYENARVVVVPAPGADFGGRGRVRIRSYIAPVMESGFFQISGLPPGEAIVRAEVRSDSKHASALDVEAVSRPERIRVLEDCESILRDHLSLQTPQKLGLVVTPPVDFAGDPWQLTLGAKSELGSNFVEILRSAVPVTGYWESEELAPGEYTLSIESSSSGRRAFSNVDLGRDPDPVIIEMDGLEVEGEVVLGEDPVPATVWFGGEYGAEKVRVQTGPDGRFATILPRAGDWYVEVTSDLLPLETIIRPLTIADSTNGGASWVSIRLPDTRIAGRVVDEFGKTRRAIVNVMLSTELSMVQVRTDERGRFEVLGLPEGLMSVEAVAAHPASDRKMLQSDRKQMMLVENLRAAPLDLVLRSQRSVEGYVLGMNGPIPGAQLAAVSTPMTGNDNPSFQTDQDGRFETGVPPLATKVAITAAAPGNSLNAIEVSVAEEALQVAVPLLQVGGVLELAEQHSSQAPKPTYFALYLNGAEVDSTLLRQWARAHANAVTPRDGYLVVPQMTPGHYRLCEKNQAWSWNAREQPLNCAEGYLSAGGALTLDLAPARANRLSD